MLLYLSIVQTRLTYESFFASTSAAGYTRYDLKHNCLKLDKIYQSIYKEMILNPLKGTVAARLFQDRTSRTTADGKYILLLDSFLKNFLSVLIAVL